MIVEGIKMTDKRWFFDTGPWVIVMFYTCLAVVLALFKIEVALWLAAGLGVVLMAGGAVLTCAIIISLALWAMEKVSKRSAQVFAARLDVFKQARHQPKKKSVRHASAKTTGCEPAKKGEPSRSPS